MTKLCQIIAVEKGVKAATYTKVTDLHRESQKPALLTGITRTYAPKDDEGEVFPPESTRVQTSADAILGKIAALMTRQFDVTATKEWANCRARADVVVEGATILAQVPVPYLLFLEKQLTDLHTIIAKLPVLDPAERWQADDNAGAGVFRTDATKTHRTKKSYRNHIKAEATDKHPAQVEIYTEDETVGYWTTVKFSGALPAARLAELTARVERLHQAVKFAREEANSLEVNEIRVGESVFAYLLG